MNGARFLLWLGAVSLSCFFAVEARSQHSATPSGIKTVGGGSTVLFATPKNPVAAKASGGRTGDQVDDALALGNAARDRKPPDLASAERAYRLAAKINPRDPRPLVGLGNIYFDRKDYSAAAQAYKEAIQLKNHSTPHLRGDSIPKGMELPKVGIADQVGNWHAYLATAMVQGQDMFGAELELRAALSFNPENAIWQAQMGYVLSAQRRYTEAAAAYQEALRLAPANGDYKELLSKDLSATGAASEHDEVISKEIAASTWQVRLDGATTSLGTCQLNVDKTLECKPLDSTSPLYNGKRWRIQDGFLEFEDAVKYPVANPARSFKPDCVGEISEKVIKLNCAAWNGKETAVWTKVAE